MVKFHQQEHPNLLPDANCDVLRTLLLMDVAENGLALVDG
jgi:hypothetical protein